MTNTLSRPEQLHTDLPLESELIARLPDNARILGREAVKASITHTSEVMDESSIGETSRLDLDLMIKCSRRELEEASPSERKKFGVRLVEEGMPEWLVDAVGAERPKDIADRLLSTSSDGTAQVNDETYLNVLQWHNSQERMKQDKAESEIIKPIRERMIASLLEQVRRGVIPAGLITDDVIDTIRKIPVVADDKIGNDYNFRVRYQSAAQGYYSGDDGFVAIRRVNAREWTEKTVIHELVHAITGRTRFGWGLNRLVPSVSPIDPSRAPSSQDHYRGIDLLNEATTEHLAQTLHHDDDIDDIKPYRITAAYKEGLLLLKALCTEGEELISPQLFVNAMLSSDSTKEHTSAVQILQNALERAFPHVDVLRLISEMDSISITGSITRKEVRKLNKTIKRKQ